MNSLKTFIRQYFISTSCSCAILSILCAFISWSFSWSLTVPSSVSSLCTCSRLALLLTKHCSSSRLNSPIVSSNGALLKKERQHTHFTELLSRSQQKNCKYMYMCLRQWLGFYCNGIVDHAVILLHSKRIYSANNGALALSTYWDFGVLQFSLFKFLTVRCGKESLWMFDPNPTPSRLALSYILTCSWSSDSSC